MIIPRGRGIILSGNRQLAAQYIQIAKRRAIELQVFMDMTNIKMAQKRYPLHTDCIWANINIIDNAVFIRIHACSEGGYKCGFPTVVSCSPSRCSRFQLFCRDEVLEIGYATRTALEWDNYEWDFGDGSTVVSGPTETSGYHAYANAGLYDISLTVTKDVVESNKNGTNNNGFRIAGSSSISAAAAYATFVGNLPGSPAGNDDVDYYTDTTHAWNGSQSWDVTAQEQDYDFDLTAVNPLATATLMVDMLRLDAVVHWPNYGDPVTVVSNNNIGATSNLGVTKFPVIGGQYAPWEEFEMGDMTPFIGTTKNIVMTASQSYAQLPEYMGGLPTPAFAPAAFNRIGMYGGIPFVKIVLAGEQEQTIKAIKVNKGYPIKKTGQIGEDIII